MKKFLPEDDEELEKFIDEFFSSKYFKLDREQFNNRMRLQDLEEFKFSEKNEEKDRLVDLFHYPDHYEIFIDLRDFKKKEISFNLKKKILSIYSSNRKFFKTIKINCKRNLNLHESEFNKGILRIIIKKLM